MSNVAVYAKGSTDFTTQGLGILADVKSSQTTQTVSDSGNVTSQLELEYPVNGRLVDKLIEGNFIRVSMATDSSKFAVYEISDTLKDDSGTITVYADPYSDRIGRMSFENGGKFGSYNSVQAALTYAKSQMKDFPSSFQLTSNISKSVDFTKDGIIPNFKKFLDLLNTKVSGNVYYGLNIIQIYSALGKDRSDIILRDDRNTSSVKVKTDYSSIINRIIPVLPIKDKDGNATQETKVGTPVISKTPNQFLDYWSAEVVQLDTQDLANTYFDRTHADRPVQTVTVDPLSMSEDFSDIDIFDRVQIYSSRLNYTDKLRVSSRVIDNLTGQVTKFSLGNSSVSIYNTIEGQTQAVLNQIQAITSIVISASGKNQTYTSNIQPTSANEGDMWIQEDGDYQAFWVFKNGDWVRLVDSNTQKDITDGVNSAIEQARLDAQALVNSNNTAIRSEMQTVATQKAQDEIKKGNFDANAQAYANSAKSAAIAQAQSLVSTQAQQAVKDLSDARLSIQNDIDITNGNVKSLTDRADGWDATIVKVDNLAVGGRNYVLNSDVSTTSNITNFKASIPVSSFSGKIITVSVQVDYDNITELLASSTFHRIMFEPVVKNAKTGDSIYLTTSITPKIGDSFHGRISATFDLTNVNIISFYTGDNSNTLAQGIYVQGIIGTNVSVSRPKIEISTITTDWTPAPEDLSAESAHAQLTADKASLDLKNYKVLNDGSVQKAQTDITVVAGKVETKISQVDYDANNKLLNQNISTATQTATEAKTTINNYKTATDGKLQTMGGQIDTVAGSVRLAATKTELNTAKSEFSSQVSSVQADYDRITQSVTELTGKLNDLGQINQLFNTEFSPDFAGWYDRGLYGKDIVASLGTPVNGSNVFMKVNGSPTRLQSAPIAVVPGTKISYSVQKLASSKIWSYINNVDVDGNIINVPGTSSPEFGAIESLGYTKKENITIPSGVVYISFGFYLGGISNGNVLSQPMLVFSDHIGTYIQGNYNNNDKIALQQITIDAITNTVSNPTTGLSTRVQTAEGFLTQVRGTDIPALQKATFWQPYSSLNFNDYTKQGSFFFNTTSVKTNGPTTSNSWLYLIVEQGTADTSRIKQTAWYDGVNGVKITYVRTLNSGTWSPWYANDNDSVATISVMNGQISQEISDRKSGDRNTLSQAKSYTESKISSSESGLNSTITQTAKAILANIGATNLFPNTEFNQDYGWRSKSGIVTYLANQNIDGQYHGVVRVVTTNNDFQGYWGKNIPVQGGYKYSGSVRVHFNNNGITAGKAMYDLWFVDKNGTRISTGTGGSVHFITNMVSSPYWIDLWADGITAPINAVYAQVSLLAVGGIGMVAHFTMPTFTATDVHQPYSPNDDITTQLALLKDKWSIGIADNLGSIVSGIVGNSAQMAIISDKVIIKSPNTQITGTAWINSAMIANGAIGTAQIGDASITSAKILSLDVGKISGNISNFVKSAWNNAYGSNVAIDGVGMVVSYGNTSTAFTNGNVLFKQLANYADGSNQVETIGSISTTHNGTVNNIVIGLYDQTHIPFGSTDGKKIGSPTGEIYGGDLIAFGKARDFNGNFDHIFSYSNQTASLKYGISEGFNFRDKINFNSNEIVSGSVNYNLKIGALKFSGKFDGKYVPVIVATWSGYLGGGIAFGNDNVVVFNQSKANIL